MSMIPANYCYNTNNIHPAIRENGGREIYPVGPGVPDLPNCLIAADMGSGIWIFARNYGAATALSLVMKFDSTDAFLSYCTKEGRLSEGGQSHC